MVRERQAPAEGAGTESDAAHTQLAPPSGGAETVAPGGVDGAESAQGNGAAFECRTCGRRFSSFQALGGHRTGHARLRARHGTPAHKTASTAAARAHGCTVCGLEFHMGQALGGHMRRHRGDGARPEEEEEVLNLNCPPLEDGAGGDREERSSVSEPRLLNLLV